MNDRNWKAPIRFPIGLIVVAIYFIVTRTEEGDIAFGALMQRIGVGWVLLGVAAIQLFESAQTAWKVKR